MTRYIVLRSANEFEDGDDKREVPVRDERPPILCETRGEAETALGEWIAGTGDDHDWSVWEVVDGKCRRRSIVFKDGNPEIQSSREES